MSKISTIPENSIQLCRIFHEIRNPLALISSSLQLIESDHPEVTDFRFWNQTRKDLSQLCTLLEDLSSYQKCTLLSTTKIHLFDFLEDLAEATETFLLSGNHPLHIINAVPEADFYGDERKLRHALINLLKNAAESSAHGTPIFLRCTGSKNRLFISICDKGPGMTKEQLLHLYDPFYTTKSDGTGLGLPITQKIIQSHGGSLLTSSCPGFGTVFTVSLPIDFQCDESNFS